jgi:hypothetical protein
MVRITWLLALVTMTMVPGIARAQDARLFNAPVLSDEDLARERGRFMLPGGIEVALAAVITTDVNGARLLQTVFQVDASGAAASAQALGGAVVRLDPRGATAAAAMPGLSVEHIVGPRLGSVVANAGDNRVVDQQLTVNLSLSNVQPLALGSTMFRVQSLGIDAGVLRATGG